MAVNTRNSIVTNGLVLHLDAANTLSYQSGSTTWNDLSGNKNNGTLVNEPTFSSGNGGSIFFDGVNDYVGFGNIFNQGLNSFTITTWFVRKNNTSGWLLSKSFAGAAVGRYWLDINNNKIRVGIAWTSGHTNYFSNSNIENDLIYNVVAVINRIGNLQIYLNGLLDAEYNISSSSKVQLNTSFPFRIGSYTDGDQITPSYFFNGNIYQTSIYNRALSQQEILQNYNATKSRFNLL